MSTLHKNKVPVWLIDYSEGVIEEEVIIKRKSGIYTFKDTDLRIDNHSLVREIDDYIEDQVGHGCEWNLKLSESLAIASTFDRAMWHVEVDRIDAQSRVSKLDKILQTYDQTDESLLHQMQSLINARLVRLPSNHTLNGFVEVYSKSHWKSHMWSSMGYNANLLLHQGLGIPDGRFGQKNLYVRITQYSVTFCISVEDFDHCATEAEALSEQTRITEHLKAMWCNYKYGFEIDFQYVRPSPWMAYTYHWCHFDDNDYEKAQYIISQQLATVLSVAARSNSKTKSTMPVMQFALSPAAARAEGISIDTDRHCLIEYVSSASANKNTYYGMSKPLKGMCFKRLDGTVSLYIQADPNHVHKLTAEAYRQLMHKPTSVLDALFEAR